MGHEEVPSYSPALMNSVEWYLVSDEEREVVTRRDDILDVIEIQKHLDRETRITDREPEWAA